MRPVAELELRADKTAGRRLPAEVLAEADEGRAEESGCREVEDEEVAARASCARASRPADEAVDDEWSLALLALLLRALPTQGRPPVVADCAVAAWPMDSLGTLAIAAASWLSAETA